MFKYPIFQDYTLGNAAGEILIMLLVAFLLGMILHHLLQKKCDCTNCAGSTLSKPDDLKVIEGIGPKIEGLLNAAGIMSWAELANTPASKVKEVLTNAGKRFQMHDPKTWAEQAELARDGKWEKLEKLQDYLLGGKE
ncbi:MAG: hypothetical protein LR005_01905 [Candidatus Pacebacteria bacterium]|nr:hypothetical protein [Candidatus Paceibacterota bacterium]